jgi:tripartite-type tricarboxylate transporter receptor subunit TctC
MVCPFNPGSVTDAYDLMMKKVAEKYVDVNIVVEYQTGGSGAVGINYAMAQKQDGYTIFTPGNNIEYGLASGRIQNWKIDDFQGIANPVIELATVCVPAKSPIKSMDDLIKYAKEKPGKLNWAGAQALAYHHIVSLLVNQVGGVNINYIPYDNGTDVALACIEGSVDVAGLPAETANTYSKSGDVRILAVGSKERSEFFPDIPTIYETPGLEFEKMGIEYSVARPIFVGKKTPPEAVKALEDLFMKAFQDPEWIEFVSKRFGTDYKTGCFGAEKTTKLVKDSSIILTDLFAKLNLNAKK